MPPDAPSPRPSHLALRIFLLLFSFSEFLAALFDLPQLQATFPHPTLGWRLASYASDTRTVLAPLIAGAAFVFAIAGKLPHAVAAMAALTLVKGFAALAWVIALRDASVHVDILGAQMFLLRYVYPLLAVAALVVLRRGTRLGLAGALALVPTGAAWLYYIFLFVLIATDPD